MWFSLHVLVEVWFSLHFLVEPICSFALGFRSLGCRVFGALPAKIAQLDTSVGHLGLQSAW